MKARFCEHVACHWRTVSNGRLRSGCEVQVPIQFKLGPLTVLSIGLGLLPRGGKGTSYRKSRIPEKPIEIWGYEASPFVRMAREVCCLPYNSMEKHILAAWVCLLESGRKSHFNHCAAVGLWQSWQLPLSCIPPDSGVQSAHVRHTCGNRAGYWMGSNKHIFESKPRMQS